MTKGKVVLVPFPFDDLSTAKVRPAVCLTEPRLQAPVHKASAQIRCAWNVGYSSSS